MQSSRNTCYLRTSHFCAKCQKSSALKISFFSSNSRLYIGKNSVEYICKVLEMELKTHQSVKNSCLRESNLTFCIIFNMISFLNTQGSVRIKLACSKVLLVNISSSNIVTHSNGYKGGDKYFPFYKSRCGKCSPETKLFTK